MAIPRNLLPENLPNELTQFSSSLNTDIASLGSISSINGVPVNLIPSNTSDIAKSIESIGGQIPQIDAPEIPEYAILNTVISDELFKTGSLDQIRARTFGAARTYVNGLPKIAVEIPTLPPISVPFPPKRPSFSQIKNYIETKIDRIKIQRQVASTRALEETLRKKEDPFAYRQSIINTSRKRI